MLKARYRCRGSGDTYHLTVAAPMKSFCKHGHHKDVDEEGHKERHGRLNKEVLIGLFHLFLVGAIHFSGLDRGTHGYAGPLIKKKRERVRCRGGAHLDQGRVQVDVVGHDDGAHNAHSLSELDGAAAFTLGDKHPLQ